MPRNLEGLSICCFGHRLDIIDLSHNPPIPSAFPFPLALPMVRHKVTVILEVLRGKETPMAFLCRKIILSQATNTVSILQLLKKHILEILPIDFPYYLSYRLDSIQVKCVTGKFTQIWDMIYVVWDQWIWGCAPSQVIERLVFLSESVFFFFGVSTFSQYIAMTSCISSTKLIYPTLGTGT